MPDTTLQNLQPLIDLRGNGTSLTPARARLLEALAQHGSISAAARAVGMSYKGAWDAITALNSLVGSPLVVAETGGVGGGGAHLTRTGQRVLAFHRALGALQQRVLSGAGDLDLDQLLKRMDNLMLRTSARNQYEGTVSALQRGAVNSEVTLALPGGDQVVAVITNHSVDELGLAVGGSAVALIKASFVLLAADGVRSSARNALPGVVVACRKGAVNAEVELELRAGLRLVATITNESVDALGVKEGARLTALVKASQVILAVAA
ncbi:TOBE domain-containing protein [Flavobacterium sp. MXW15]|uniref:TOBE domain-containing protein n=1 Tax=Xanthomonas chitinilytica TaxID=2989819 RepID=A0ABT3JVP2_9XANT|nr:TOBE domain-containing protein [Xanthomonas sp. H13-6]MCW4454835.1 TOBE domain-containing protein [Flavobacterium sp. MXW15]MCW4472537.1 TOBE domain-containing protein [Xanthomonas sp. H13-6]